MRSLGSLWLLAALSLPAFAGCLDSEAPETHAHEAEGHDHHEAMDEHAHDAASGHAAHSFRTPMGLDADRAPDLSHEPPFPLEAGKRPTESEARDFDERYESVRVKGNEGLAKLRAEGYLRGSGTLEDPYLLERFYVARDLTIESTDRALVLRDGYVAGTLRLNYVGEALYVHHVYANDLRVNENIKRSGPNTGGLFHDNAFAIVGQIRHFVGEFRDNHVGPRPSGFIEDAAGDVGPFAVPEGVVFNLDGFHRADIHDNVFEGAVLAKLHGHNHGDCFTCPVHDHANATLDEERMAGHEHSYSDEAEMASLGMTTHHSVRYASLAFHDNEIRVERGVALRYHDRNHAGDDRTANSEPNERLDDAHVHFQDVTFARNRLVSGGFHLDIFNAEDKKHVDENLGALRILANDITVHYARSSSLEGGAAPILGLLVNDARGLELRVRDNVVRFAEVRSDAMDQGAFDPLRSAGDMSGLQIHRVEFANLTIEGNRVESGTYGVFASKLASTVHWTLAHNDFRTTHAWRGSDVSEPPREDP